MERGACTFAQKVVRAEAAGAAAVIIIQTLDIWPYTMTDSTGEGRGISIPAFMMSTKHGKGYRPVSQSWHAAAHVSYHPVCAWISRLVTFLREKNAADTVADIVVRKDARECVICQVDMSIGMTVTRMPCQVCWRRLVIRTHCDRSSDPPPHTLAFHTAALVPHRVPARVAQDR